MTDAQRIALCEKHRDNPALAYAELILWLEETEGVKVSKSAISKTLKKSAVILQNTDRHDKGSKRHRSVRYPLMEKALIEWFLLYKGQIQMNGRLIVAKGKYFLKALYGEEEQFQFSDGWLTSFKERYGIHEYHAVRESGSVSAQTLEEAIPRIRERLDKYSWRDIYNMDETSLFYRMQPGRALATKQLEGKKKDKERITIVNCANGDGSDKLPLWIIGKYENPRCFKNVKLSNLEVTYRANTKAWMTLKIFHDWLKWFDGRANRRVLFILGNCSAHSTATTLPPLMNTEVLYLPPNMTSKLQPMGAGVIRSFKTHYRLRFSEQVLSNLENGFPIPARINILTGISIAVRAWDEVSSTTIANCFNHCKIRTPTADMEISRNDKNDNGDVLEQLTSILEQLPYQDLMSVNFLLNHPDEQEAAFTPSEEDIVEQLQQPASEPEGENEDEVVVRSEYNIAQAVKAMQQMTLFWQFQDHDTQGLVSMSKKMLQAAKDLQQTRLRQSIMHNFF